ncbi:MAG: LysR family transcriptional regulator [Alphaproteobacteria bacterium]|nr:LysR family transcriptional regulator [Alphaproteobacteria bacterium]
MSDAFSDIPHSALRYFRTVVRTGSIRAAAGLLNVAPSAVSRQILKLEDELGTRLFTRQPRGVALTAAGEVIASFTHDAFLQFERVRSELNDMKDNRIGNVTLCCVEGAVGDFLPRAIAGFQTRHPGISITVNVRGTHDVVDTVLDDGAEVGISFNAGETPNIRIIERVHQRLNYVVSSAHRFAGKRMLGVADIADEAIALPDASFGIRRLVDAIFAEHGIVPRPALESNSIEALRRYVSANDRAVTFMPHFTVGRDIELKRLVPVPMREKQLALASMEIIARKGRPLTVPVERFLDVLIPTLRQIDEGSR